MPTGGNILDNNTLAAFGARAPSGVTSAIRQASVKTGVDFAYLMEKAAAESSFDPAAKAKTSSASGLYQFIESTWLDMVDRHGAKHGIPANADKQSVLEMRHDPKISALMAAEFAKENKNFLEKHVGGDIGPTEMYFAHFMGAGGAAGFLKALKDNPLSVGADLFPAEARANRSVFYDSKTGQPRNLQEIYAFFDGKFSEEPLPAPAAKSPVYQPVSPSHRAISRTIEGEFALYETAMQKYLSMLLLTNRSDENRHHGGIFPSALGGHLAMSPVDMVEMIEKSL